MIAGNHDRANAGALRAGHGLLCLLARRIDHADQAQKDEFVLDALVHFFVLKRIRRQLARGDAQRAQRLAGKFFIDLQNLRSPLVGQRPLLFAHKFLRAAGEQHVRRTFGEDEQSFAAVRRRYERSSSTCARTRTELPRRARNARRVLHPSGRLCGPPR